MITRAAFGLPEIKKEGEPVYADASVSCIKCVKKWEIVTVGDIIKKLEAFPLDTPVVTDGYEDGFSGKVIVKKVYLQEDGNDCDDDGVYGRHGRVSNNATEKKGSYDLIAICIGMGRHLIR